MQILSGNLKKGDPCPPRTNLNLLRVYGFQFCPYVKRVLLVLNAKQIEHEVINVNLQNKPDWLVEKNPASKVPIIEFGQDSQIIADSLDIIKYLNETYPDNNNQHAKDDTQKADRTLLVDNFGKVNGLFYKLLINDKSAELKDEILSLLKLINSSLAKLKPTKFFSGDLKPGTLDYVINPFIERLPALFDLIFGKTDAQNVWKELPTIKEYRNQLLTDSAVKNVTHEYDVQIEFLKHVKVVLVNQKK